MVLILYLTFLFLVSIMVFYLVRHYLFSLSALYNQRGQPYYILHGLSYKPTVSILIPARDEDSVLGKLLQRLTELTYPKDMMEVIVIDDASTDNTGRTAEEFVNAYDYFKVIHRSPSVGGKGKPSALNEGFEKAKGEILVCFDADYYPQIDILEKLAAYFIDPEVGAVQGRVTVFNEHATWVSRLVTIERIGGYRVDQLARDDFRLIPQCGGTVCGFRRSLLESLGGWDAEALTEDTDMTFQVYLTGYKIRYVNEAECYEEAVESWSAYWHQRHRWAKGHMQCFFKHVLPLIGSRNLTMREKIDGFLLLNTYFVPIFVGLSWLLGAAIFFLCPPNWFESVWTLLPAFLYSSFGNFASFFETGIGIYLDRRVRTSWIIPLLMLSFVLNTLISFNALFDLALSKVMRRKMHNWTKTIHKGWEAKWL